MICPNCEATMTRLFGTLYQCPECRLEQYAAAIMAYWAETGAGDYWDTDPPADWTPAQYGPGTRDTIADYAGDTGGDR